ncbi:MAG TPA: hypothetical protein VN702_20925 [Acetobacteraceae bacterium]|nr:hypothetical protein [Acetobacteraceae bacterium]
MKPIPHTPETDALARRLVWFEEPAEALADPVRFLAYAFETATHEDMSLLRRYISEDDFREALNAAPPGIIRPRSWAYWHARFGQVPAPPLPQRWLG